MPAVAITDPSNLFAAVKFYRAARAAGIKPILGADIFLENHREPTQPFRLTVLCQNNIGYHNLLRLISISFLTRHGTQPLLTAECIKTHAEGLILLSGAHEGDVGHALLTGNTADAGKRCQYWQKIFGDRFYLEIRRTGQVQDEPHVQAAILLATQYDVPLVATNDVRFPARDDFEAHEARVCIHAGYVLNDARRPKNYTEQQYFRHQAEMLALFTDLPSALQNTLEIAKRWTVTLTLGKNFLPRCDVPSGFTTEQWLANNAQEGLQKHLTRLHISPEKFNEYDTRLATEIDVINRMGFAAYFLIVADFTRWARNNGVPVGPGRGSGPGSLVAWSLGITDLDPIAHELLFERFLNPERVSMPDFDIDFCMEGRDRVIEYVMQTHGHEAVAQIITYGTMAARAVVRDVGRVLGNAYGFVDKIAKLIPFELGMTLEKALVQEDQLATRYQTEEDVRTLIDLAKRLEGMTRNVGRHAGGVVIAPSKLTEFTPLYCEPGDPDHPVTQFDKDDVEAVGLVKFDFLGLRTLTIIDRAIKNIVDEKIDIHTLATNDTATFSLLKACNTTAVFQLESRGMKDLVKRLQPDCFEDIVALVALFRPGPLQSGMVEDFINRKHGRARVSYPHPLLEPILRPTYGVIVYQEQVMQIAQVLAGYSLGAADILRRAMGKKKPEEMEKQRVIFCAGATERGVAQETATAIFDLMEKFAGYGFNKSHSAAYALIAYQTAWLKAHHPAAYMAAVLSSDMDHTDKVVLFIEDCEKQNLRVLAPDINHSEYHFKVLDHKTLAWGLGAIKGMGETAIAAIVAARGGGAFKDLFDFCKRVDIKKLNRRSLEALIRAGAMDCLDSNRANLMATLEAALHYAEKATHNRAAGQRDLFGNTDISMPALQHTVVPAWTEAVRLNGEKETLGLYLSGHPIERYLTELASITNEKIIDLYPTPGKMITIAGIINTVRMIQTKRGDRMAVIQLEDASASLDVICFAESFQQYRELLVKDNLIVVSGEVSHDDFNDGNRMVVEEILSMEAARSRYAKYLRIDWGAEQLDLDHGIRELTALLEPYRGGSCPVVIRYQQQQAQADLRLGETWHVKPSDALLNSMRTWLTDKHVAIVYR